MRHSNSKHAAVRIIGGRWRGRKIIFVGDGKIRPTSDRIRETLFNWLTPYISGARCLDLYAGSGAMGFEALSRGAVSVIAVEYDKTISHHILTMQKTLQADGLQLVQSDVLQWLSKPGQLQQPYDVIFLDPPYAEQALLTCCQLLEKNKWTKNGTLIYYEHNAPIDNEFLPSGWQVIKAKKAGQVFYYLVRVL